MRPTLPPMSMIWSSVIPGPPSSGCWVNRASPNAGSLPPSAAQPAAEAARVDSRAGWSGHPESRGCATRGGSCCRPRARRGSDPTGSRTAGRLDRKSRYTSTVTGPVPATWMPASGRRIAPAGWAYESGDWRDHTATRWRRRSAYHGAQGDPQGPPPPLLRQLLPYDPGRLLLPGSAAHARPPSTRTESSDSRDRGNHEESGHR